MLQKRREDFNETKLLIMGHILGLMKRNLFRSLQDVIKHSQAFDRT